MPFLNATINPSPVDPRFALVSPVDESGRTEAISDIPDIQHQAYKYGVIGDTTKAVGKIAQDVHLGYTKGKLQGQLENIYSPIQDSQLQIAQLESDVGDLQRRKRMAADHESIRAIEPEYIRKTEALIKAKEQGAIVSKEYELRQAQVLREAINRNPGYTSALIEHARDTLYASGIRKIEDPYIEIDRAKREADKETRTFISAQAARHGIAFDPAELNTEGGRQRIISLSIQAAEKKQLVSDMLNGVKIKTATDLATRNQREDHANDLKAGARLLLNDIHSQRAIALSQITDKAQRAEYELQFANNLEDKIKDFEDGLRERGFPPSEIDKHSKDVRNYSKILSDTTKEITSGKLTNKQGEAAISMAKVQAATYEELGFAPDFIKRARKYTPQTLAALAKDNPRLAEHYKQFIKIDAGLIDPAVRKALTEKIPGFDNQTAAVHYLKTFIESGVPEHISDIMDSIQNVYHGNFPLLKKEDKVILRDGVISPLAKLSPDASKYLPAEVKEGTNSMLADQLQDVVKYMKDASAEVDNVASLTPTGEFNLTVYKKGTTSINESQTREARSRIAARINEVISANAVINGLSKTEAASQVLAPYADELGITLPQQEQGSQKGGQDMLTKEFIKSKEGFREKAYQDEGGKWTIGFGFTSIEGVPVKEGDTISKEDAEFQMDRILDNHQSFKSKITRTLTPYQEDALASFEFNLGGNVWNQPRGRKIIDAINEGDFNTAAELWRTYNKVKNPKTGKYEVSKGLSSRREQEANMLLASGE